MFKILSVPVVVAMLAGAGTSFVIVPPFHDDGAILAGMALRDTTEIQLGQMAVEKGQSAAVKEYGRMLLRDHTAHLKEVRALAGKLGVSAGPEAWPADVKVDNDAALRRIGETGVNGFDTVLLDFAYEGHAAAIRQTEEEDLPNSQNAQVKSLLQKTMASLRRHLAGAKQLIPAAERRGK